MAEEETELEPSGYVTSDGKDLDERYLQEGEQLTTDAAKDSVCEIVLREIGVRQQEPITGTVSPYTLPQDAFVTFECRCSFTHVQNDTHGYGHLSVYINDTTLYYKDAEFYGQGGDSHNLGMETVYGYFPANTVFKCNVSAHDMRTGLVFKVTATPYRLFKYSDVTYDEV